GPLALSAQALETRMAQGPDTLPLEDTTLAMTSPPTSSQRTACSPGLAAGKPARGPRRRPSGGAAPWPLGGAACRSAVAAGGTRPLQWRRAQHRQASASDTSHV